MMYFRQIFIALTASFIGVNISAQDIHFSQFFHTHYNLNPALTGAFDGDYRFAGVHRNQWRSVTVPYSTFGIAADMNLPNKSSAAGLNILQDKTGDSRFKTLRIEPAASLKFALDTDSSNWLSAGIQLSISHKSIDYSDLYFDNQYNGFSYDPGINSNESFARDAMTYFDVNLGVAWKQGKKGENQYEAGIALFNLLGADQGLFGEKIALDTRINLHGNAVLPVDAEWEVQPSLLFASQGKYKELILGASAKKIIEDRAGIYRTVFGGMYFRTRDAGFIMAGLDYDQWKAAVSYDINLSELRPASNGRGGIEISVIYILRSFKPVVLQKRICPEYL
jgi:type IX secretion system PorP/SprF family membrane protein